MEPECAGGPYGGRSTDAPEQRDLSESLSMTERCDDVSVSDHLGLARLDHVVAVADVALLEHDVACGHCDRFQAAGELFHGGQRQGVQHAHGLQQPNIPIADTDGSVQSSQPVPRNRRGDWTQ